MRHRRAPEPPPLAYSVPDAARRLGLSRSYAYQLVASGEIPSVRLGGRVVVPAKALDELLASAS